MVRVKLGKMQRLLKPNQQQLWESALIGEEFRGYDKKDCRAENDNNFKQH